MRVIKTGSDAINTENLAQALLGRTGAVKTTHADTSVWLNDVRLGSWKWEGEGREKIMVLDSSNAVIDDLIERLGKLAIRIDGIEQAVKDLNIGELEAQIDALRQELEAMAALIASLRLLISAKQDKFTGDSKQVVKGDGSLDSGLVEFRAALDGVFQNLPAMPNTVSWGYLIFYAQDKTAAWILTVGTCNRSLMILHARWQGENYESDTDWIVYDSSKTTAQYKSTQANPTQFLSSGSIEVRAIKIESSSQYPSTFVSAELNINMIKLQSSKTINPIETWILATLPNLDDFTPGYTVVGLGILLKSGVSSLIHVFVSGNQIQIQNVSGAPITIDPPDFINCKLSWIRSMPAQ
jgi:archaellum component FlaC